MATHFSSSVAYGLGHLEGRSSLPSKFLIVPAGCVLLRDPMSSTGTSISMWPFLLKRPWPSTGGSELPGSLTTLRLPLVPLLFVILTLNFLVLLFVLAIFRLALLYRPLLSFEERDVTLRLLHSRPLVPRVWNVKSLVPARRSPRRLLLLRCLLCLLWVSRLFFLLSFL